MSPASGRESIEGGTKELKALVPMAHVHSVLRSVEFYRKPGFVVANTHAPEGGVEPVWAWLTCGGAQLMLAQAGDFVDPAMQARRLVARLISEIDARAATG